MNNFKIDKKKMKLAIGVLTPVAICGAGVGIYYVVKSKNAKQEVNIDVTETKSKTIYGLVDIFPKVNPYEFYDEIRIINGQPQITDDFTSSVVTKILKEIKMTDGNIKWGIKMAEDRKSLQVTFNWEKDAEHNYWKTYTFTLSV